MTEWENQSHLSGYAGEIIEQAAELPLEDQVRLLLIARRNGVHQKPDALHLGWPHPVREERLSGRIH